MKDEFNLETKDEIKRNIDLGVIRLATELKEDIDNEFIKANERLVNQQVLINTLINRIDKAIEYIEQEVNNCDIYCDGCTPQHCPDIKKILDILKGSDKDDK